MGRHFIIVNDDKDREDNYRRDEMFRRMSGRRDSDFRNYDGVRMGDYRANHIYDEGYREGYENAWKDHEQHMAEEGFRRTRYGW